MAYVELRPVKFNNFLGKRRFLSEAKPQNVLLQLKNMVAVKNTPDNFMLWSKPEIQKAMAKNDATFLIMSNRQLGYITFHLLKWKFNLNDVKIYSSFERMLVDSENFIADDYENWHVDDIIDFFDKEIETDIAELDFQKKKQLITVKSNGVIGLSGFDHKDESGILSLIGEAYNESQR